MTRHAFNDSIAKKRPDREDKAELESFAEKTAEILKAGDPEEITLGPVGPYYRPLREDGEPAVFLKAKPLTRIEDCYRCGLCVRTCSMGSIEVDCVTVSGICRKVGYHDLIIDDKRIAFTDIAAIESGIFRDEWEDIS